MLLTEREVYPLLEMHSNSKHSHTIEDFFNKIRNFSLCWLAEEELEMTYPDHRVNSYLSYKRSGNMIEIIEKSSKKAIAKIRFNSL